MPAARLNEFQRVVVLFPEGEIVEIAGPGGVDRKAPAERQPLLVERAAFDIFARHEGAETPAADGAEIGKRIAVEPDHYHGRARHQRDLGPAPSAIGGEQPDRAPDIAGLEAGAAIDARGRGSGKGERRLASGGPVQRQFGEIDVGGAVDRLEGEAVVLEAGLVEELVVARFAA